MSTPAPAPPASPLPPPPPLSPLPRTVRLLIAARAVNRLGAFSLAFLTVLISTEFRVGPATAGLVGAAFGLATIPSRLAGGRLADRLGPRRTIVLGLTGCAIAQLGLAGARDLPAAVGWAVLLGLAFELYEPPSQAMISDAVPADQRARAFGLLGAALAVAGLAAGLLAAALGHWGLRWLFVADAVTCLACAAVVRAVLPADARPAVRGPSAAPAAARPSPWRDRALVVLIVTGTLFALVYLQLTTALPLALARSGRPPAQAGLLYAVSALTVLAGQPLLRRRPSTRAGRSPQAARPGHADRAALRIGYLLFAAGLAGYAFAHTLPALLATTVLWSLGDLLLLGRVYAVVADLAPPGATGRYLAAYGTSWGIAAVAAPLLGTQALTRFGTTGLWLGLAACSLVLAATTSPGRRPPPASPA
ncbi:MFS transporter [Kitasatospora sp. LaBMicrA B282]|uniref:MFS transporter n=1 Tax=Kitasatospora sp. LaBMicrA B282 TaxID=3420949 RepID=UPI003D0C0C97